MSKGKRAVIGEGISTIYRLVLVSFVAFAVFGLSGIFYSTNINVRDIEAEIMAENILNCLAPEGVLDLSLINEENKNNILKYCGYDDSETSRFYVRGSATSSAEEGALIEFSQGDSGLIWIKDLFEKTKTGKDIKKYEPGSFKIESVLMYVLDSGNKKVAELELEVFVNNEF